MPNKTGITSKKDLVIFYVIDTSGSMDGAKISTVDRSMEENIRILKYIADDYPEINLKIAVLTFANRAKWLTPNGPVPLDEFEWKYIEKTGGGTVFGSFLKELYSKLTRTQFLDSSLGNYMPVIIFMSDGAPTDEDWEETLSKLCDTNDWFKWARKIAIAIDDGFGVADTVKMKKALAKVVGNENAVVNPDNLAAVKRMIVTLSATAAHVAGQSRMIWDTDDVETIISSAEKTSEEMLMRRKDPDTFTQSKSQKNSPEVGQWNDEDWRHDV